MWSPGLTNASGGRAVSERGEAYRAFFQDLIDRLREQHRFTYARVGQDDCRPELIRVSPRECNIGEAITWPKGTAAP